MPRKAARQAVRKKAQPARESRLLGMRRMAVRAGWVLGVVALTALTARAGVYLLDLRVERLVVHGAGDHVAKEDLETQLAPVINAGFFTLDLNTIRSELESMPWVYAASVRRRWPDALVVNIEEQRPVARWGLDGFLNHEGEYFPGDFSDRWAALARLEGPEGSEVAMTRRYQNLESLLAPTGLQVVALHEDVLGQVTAELDSGCLLLLGAENHRQRISRFVTLWRGQLQGQPLLRVDMRYEHGAAVAPLPGTQWAQGNAGAEWKEIR